MLGVDPAASVYVANDPRKDFAGARAAGLATIRSGSLPDEGGAIRVSLRDGIDADAVTDGLAEIGRRLLEEPI
jgi:FMN phosphatase YigB (HAD superfamily)